MAPPRTTMAIGQQQQQPYANGQQSQQANPSQAARSVRNRKTKQAQQQQQQQPNHNINSNPIEKTQRDVAAAQAQNGATKLFNNGHTSDNFGSQKQRVELDNKIQQSLNTSTTTTNGAKTHSPIKVNNSEASNSPAPSERTTIKQRKEAKAAATAAAVALTQSAVENHNQKLDKKQPFLNTPGDKVAQQNTAPNNNNKKNLITMSQEKQQAQLTLSSQSSNVVAAAENNNNGSVLTSKDHINSSMDDDIDAGIELDGSSNSGSSVKDANEDQMKSNSVSPVMLSAQPQPQQQQPPLTTTTKLIAETVIIAAPVTQKTTTTTTSNPITTTTVSSESILDSMKKPQATSELKRTSATSQLVAAELSKRAIGTSEAVEKNEPTITGEPSLPSPAKLDDATSLMPANLSPKNASKKTTMTRDELAKERQVIEADEQLIQERLESKQRKFSGASTSSLVANGDASCVTVADQDNATLKNDSVITSNANEIKPAYQSAELEAAAAAATEPINLQKNDISKSSSSATRIKRQFSSHTNASNLAAGAANGGLKSLCKNCGLHVYQMERMLAEKSLYHKQCFRCYQCNMQLRIDNYASHEGQVYCKLHHKQIFQPQVKLNKETDLDSVAKSTTKQVDEYLLQRGRLSELTFSFLNNTIEGSRQRQMIICENEPVELSKDVIRSDTKIDDGFNNLKLNLSNILQKFENGSASNANADADQDSSSVSPIVIEKPRFNIKQKLAAFENNQVMPQDDSSSDEQQQSETANKNYTSDKPVVGKLGNVSNLFCKFDNTGSQIDQVNKQQKQLNNVGKKVTVKRSESLMGRLKKYESRIAGEHVEDDDDDDNTSSGDDATSNKANNKTSANILVAKTVPKKINIRQFEQNLDPDSTSQQQNKIRVKNNVPKLGSIDLSSLKNRWENGDIKNVSHYDDDTDDDNNNNNNNKFHRDICNHDQRNKINNYNNNDNDNNATTTTNNSINVGDNINTNGNGLAGGQKGDDKNLNSPMAEKREELLLIRQQLAQRRGSGKLGSVKNIYENALREAEELQKNQLASSRRDSSDLNALNKLSTSEIQQQLLQQKQQQQNNNNINNNNNNNNNNNINSNSSTQQSTSNKDHFQLNNSRRANKLKEKFELGLINNNTRDDDDSEASDSNESSGLTKLEQIRQEKLEDLSVFTDGEIKAREARTMFQQIDRRLSSSSSGQHQLTPTTPTRSFFNSPRSSTTTTATAATTTTVGS